MAPLRRLRHEYLVREYIATGGNGAEAYRRAHKRYQWGPQHGNPKRLRNPRAATVCASRILSYPSVQERYKELCEQMAKKADITIEKILTDYQEALLLAKSQEKPDAIVNAATAQAKLVGLLKDRVEAGRPGDFERMENVSQVLEAVAQEAGAEAALALAKAMGLKIEKAPPDEPEALYDLEALRPESETVN